MTAPYVGRSERGVTDRLLGRRRWPWLLILPLVLALGWQAAAAEPPLRLAALAPCTSGQPELTIVVLDVSDSVIANGGADPAGRSFDEARAVAEHLAAHPCSPDDRFGAVIFADRSVAAEPTLLSSLSVVRAGLRRPPQHEIGSGTNLSGALGVATAMAQRFPQHHVNTVVLSDMVVDDADSVRSAIGDLSARSTPHLVALGDHDPTFDGLVASVTELEKASRGEVASALVAAINANRQGV